MSWEIVSGIVELGAGLLGIKNAFDEYDEYLNLEQQLKKNRQILDSFSNFPNMAIKLFSELSDNTINKTTKVEHVKHFKSFYEQPLMDLMSLGREDKYIKPLSDGISEIFSLMDKLLTTQLTSSFKKTLQHNQSRQTKPQESSEPSPSNLIPTGPKR